MKTFAVVLLLGLIRCTTTDTPPAAAPAAPPVTKKAETNSAMTITGTVTKEGVECPAVRTDDGKLYTIVGKDREKLQPGVRVKITGDVAEMSTCMQGVTINATSIEVLSASVHS